MPTPNSLCSDACDSLGIRVNYVLITANGCLSSVEGARFRWLFSRRNTHYRFDIVIFYFYANSTQH